MTRHCQPYRPDQLNDPCPAHIESLCLIREPDLAIEAQARGRQSGYISKPDDRLAKRDANGGVRSLLHSSICLKLELTQTFHGQTIGAQSG